MRSHRVVIVLPCCQYFAGMGKRREQRFVQAFVPQPAVEALDEGVLLGFAGRNVVPPMPVPVTSSASPCW